MLSCSPPLGIRKVSDQYKSAFSATSTGYTNITALFSYFLFSCSSLSEMTRYCVWSKSVSDLSRAVAKFDGPRFMRRCRSSLLRKYKGMLNPEDFIIAVDDTANPRYGKSIFGCGRWHSSKGMYWGQKIVVIALVDVKRNIALPLTYAFAMNKSHPLYKPLLTLVLDLIDDCIAAGLPKLNVVADSWFDASELMNGLNERGITFIVEVKCSRKARTCTGRNVVYKRIGSNFSTPTHEAHARPHKKNRRRGRPALRFYQEKVLQIKTLKTPIKVIAVFNKRTSKVAFAYFASTDRTMPGAKVWKIFKFRWSIEVLFRDLKQNLSFGRLPCSCERAAHLAVCLPFALLISLRLQKEIWAIAKDETIGSMIQTIKEDNLQSGIAKLSLLHADALRLKVREKRFARELG